MDFASLEPLRLIEALAWIERSYFWNTLAFGEVIVSSWAFYHREKGFNETRKKDGREQTTYCTARSVGVTGEVQKTDVLVGERVMQGRGETPFICRWPSVTTVSVKVFEVNDI